MTVRDLISNSEIDLDLELVVTLQCDYGEVIDVKLEYDQVSADTVYFVLGEEKQRIKPSTFLFLNYERRAGGEFTISS